MVTWSKRESSPPPLPSPLPSPLPIVSKNDNQFTNFKFNHYVTSSTLTFYDYHFPFQRVVTISFDLVSATSFRCRYSVCFTNFFFNLFFVSVRYGTGLPIPPFYRSVRIQYVYILKKKRQIRDLG